MSDPQSSPLDAGTCTHRGDRESNEDRAVNTAGGRVCAVADGMGGARGGGVASQIAVETVSMVCEDLVAHRDAEDLVRDLDNLCERANQFIAQASRQEPELLGMGTTLTVAVLSEGSVSFAHVGDTRLYRWRQGTLEQLTLDHTRSQQKVSLGLLPTESAARSTDSSVLVRFLGTVRRVQPQLGTHDLLPADRLMISSDGLHDPLGHKRIGELLSLDLPSADLARRLVDAARSERGGNADNLTAVVVRIH